MRWSLTRSEVFELRVGDQWPDPAPSRGHVRPPHLDREVVLDGLEDELDVLLARPGVESDLGFRVRGASDGVALPGQQEHHPAVFGLGHDHSESLDGVVVREGDVHAAAGRDEAPGFRVGHLPHRVRERATSVDDLLRADLKGSAGGLVPDHRPRNPTALVVSLDQVHDLGVVGNGGALLGGGAGQQQAQPSVVELSIIVNDASLERSLMDVLCPQGRELPHGLARGHVSRPGQPLAPRQRVVGLHPGPKVRDLPPLVARGHDGSERDRWGAFPSSRFLSDRASKTKWSWE